MSFLIDRRQASKQKSLVNRQRFMRRYRKQIRKAVAENLRARSITNTASGEKISIPARDLREPFFHHGRGGRVTRVFPGNEKFVRGDQFPRPEAGSGGSGPGSSDSGEGMDEFVFQISQQEFLDALFEDMELPNLTKRQLSGVDEFKRVKAGFSREGTPTNISIIRSMRSATARRIALGATKRRELRELEENLAALPSSDETRLERRELEERIDQLREQLARIPFLDDFDIQYHRHSKEPVPHSKAVMFCLMDVSGSMDQATKDLAKRFFILLYLFLSRNYEKTDVVFIRHHTSAKEVDEEEFFYSRETGGTIVSSALKLMRRIMRERYPASE
ncbi:MAG TPA: YeaH/YhbH family protein, partial [Anaerolineales bacterium]|nr:YeaH/YhbH family protein [Anaerolineales bacterium]